MARWLEGMDVSRLERVLMISRGIMTLCPTSFRLGIAWHVAASWFCPLMRWPRCLSKTPLSQCWHQPFVPMELTEEEGEVGETACDGGAGLGNMTVEIGRDVVMRIPVHMDVTRAVQLIQALRMCSLLSRDSGCQS